MLKTLKTIFCSLQTVILACVFASAAGCYVFAQDNISNKTKSAGKTEISVFEMPSLRAQQLLVARLFAARQYNAVERALQKMLERYPNNPALRVNLAQLYITQNKPQSALDNLAKAIRSGYYDVNNITKNFPALMGTQEFQDLLNEARLLKRRQTSARKKITPFLVKQGIAAVQESNTLWDPRQNILRSLFRFERKRSKSDVVFKNNGPIAKKLNAWYRGGLASGNHGDLYDNRDRKHSWISNKRLPQLTHINYSENARKAGIDYGVNRNLFFNAVTIGNSSTAVTKGKFWRSQARLALTRPGNANILFTQYTNNHIYIYPSHRDYTSKHGDLFPANTPYMIVSKGSSGSDQPFLNAIAMILASLNPSVKAHLRSKRLIMPTVQMIFRWGQKSVNSEADYLSGKAHPTVFAAENIDLAKMIDFANKLEIGDIPPLVKLSVIKEDQVRVGENFFGPASLSERLIDTPGAIARIVRSTQYSKKLVVKAETQSTDTKQKYHWVVLKGNKKKIKINYLNEEKSIAELIVPWHERLHSSDSPENNSGRVEIGVFVSNGKYLSAPSFVNFLHPAKQYRKYNDRNQIARLDYNYKEYRSRYSDPLIFPRREWSDHYEYDEKNRLIGWTRIKKGGQETKYTRHGAKVVEFDTLGRATKAELMRYRVKNTSDRKSKIYELGLNKILFYQYLNENDFIGTVVDNRRSQ